MFENIVTDQIVNLAVREPGMIVGPIAKFLGVIYNIVFNFIYNMNAAQALGLTIILFTILVKTVLMPLSFKQQKSTYAMQKLQPEMDKIKSKYNNKKNDPSSQQKMALEIQKLQKDNNVSMLGGCLPLLVQLPILYALFYMFQQAYVYIDVIEQNYVQIADLFLTMPEAFRVDLLTNAIFANEMTVDVANQADLVGLINQLTVAQWSEISSSAGEYASSLNNLLVQKNDLETFIGINLIRSAGYSFPGILIPLLAGGTTFASSKILTRNSSSNGQGMEQAAQTMKIMNTVMPIMMGFMCINLPAGVGLYWTISNLLQIVQSLGLSKYFRAKDARESGGVIQ